MKWKKWMNLFIESIQGEWMLTVDDLREAWKNGKTPNEMALANDGLSNDYAEAA